MGKDRKEMFTTACTHIEQAAKNVGKVKSVGDSSALEPLVKTRRLLWKAYELLRPVVNSLGGSKALRAQKATEKKPKKTKKAKEVEQDSRTLEEKNDAAIARMKARREARLARRAKRK